MSSAPPAFQLASYPIRPLGFETSRSPLSNNHTSSLIFPRKTPNLIHRIPYEIWSRIFWNLDVSTPKQFALVCRLFRLISDDPHARSGWFITRYGRAMGLLQGFRMHRVVLTPEVGRLMLSAGCALPRFVVQLVDKEYHRPDRTRRPVSAALFVFFIMSGYKIYGSQSDFKEDDVSRYERCLFATNLAPQDAIETIRTLSDSYGFVPVRGLGSPIDETVYLTSKLDLTLVKSFIRNGLDLPYINDMILERVLLRSDITDAILQSYLTIGFELTPAAIKRGIQMARTTTLDVLRLRTTPVELQKLADESVVDMFGPTIRGFSFTPEAIDFVMRNFEISEAVMESALFRIPGAPSDLPDSFPATRCYMKANPCPTWKWVLNQYGPLHRFTMACFDDAISRAAAERELHALHDVFLDAGVLFRPRHVKILACRVLHKDMVANALHLMKIMRSQVISAAREYVKEVLTSYQSGSVEKTSVSLIVSGKSNGSTSAQGSVASSSVSASVEASGQGGITSDIGTNDGSGNPVNESDASGTTPTPPASSGGVAPRWTPEIREVWLRALREEITENDEWDHRMRTTQLEGGPRGGAFRISRPPDDALRFLEESKEFVAELSSSMFNVPPPPPPATATQSMSLFFGRGVGGGRSGRSGSTSGSAGSGSGSGSLTRRRGGRRGATRQNSAPAGGSAGGTSSGAGAGAGAASDLVLLPGRPLVQEAAPIEEEGVVNGDNGAAGEDGDGEGEDEEDQVPAAAPSSSSVMAGVAVVRRRSVNRAVEGISRRVSTWLSAFSERGMFNHWENGSAGVPGTGGNGVNGGGFAPG
ncbi:hypothetical protein HDU76_006173, partial [Blyttiomyces sp. JEL0837]